MSRAMDCDMIVSRAGVSFHDISAARERKQHLLSSIRRHTVQSTEPKAIALPVAMKILFDGYLNDDGFCLMTKDVTSLSLSHK